MRGDVKSAFRHLFGNAEICSYFVGCIPALNAFVVDLALPFGWTGSPAHYGAFGSAISFLVRRESPDSLRPVHRRESPAVLEPGITHCDRPNYSYQPGIAVGDSPARPTQAGTARGRSPATRQPGTTVCESPACTPPSVPSVDGATPFFCYEWVDDHILIEPDCDDRLELCEVALRLAMLAVLGPRAINERSSHRGRQRRRLSASNGTLPIGQCLCPRQK
jgi:hypothetical protein